MAVSNYSSSFHSRLGSMLKKRWVAAFSVSVVVVGTGTVCGLKKESFICELPDQDYMQSVVITTEYDQIDRGMTLTDVRAILGNGLEISQTEHTSKFVWRKLDGSVIIGTFQNNVLIEKEQTGLGHGNL